MTVISFNFTPLYSISGPIRLTAPIITSVSPVLLPPYINECYLKVETEEHFIFGGGALRCNAGYSLILHEVYKITHNDATQSVGLLWTSDQLVAETST